MPGDVHHELVAPGAKWLKRQGFSVVATELVTGGTREQADAIGFRSNCSALIEAKASRSDFLADARKPHLMAGGLGVYRFYLCPPGVIEIADLPARWGLLHVVSGKVVEVLRPRGNMWPPNGSSNSEWARFQHESDGEAERAVLYSIARRRSFSRSEERYEKQLQEKQQEIGRLSRESDKLAEQVKNLELALYLAKNGRDAVIQDHGVEVCDVQEIRAAIRRKIA